LITAQHARAQTENANARRAEELGHSLMRKRSLGAKPVEFGALLVGQHYSP
jgi:hypothetical protein